jgi:hypothetical protein
VAEPTKRGATAVEKEALLVTNPENHRADRHDSLAVEDYVPVDLRSEEVRATVLSSRERPTTPATPASPARGRRWTRALNVLPAIAFLATFGVFFVHKNREARTVFKSGRGFLTMVAIIGGYLAIGFVLRRFVRWSWVAPVVLTATVLILAAWIVRPYYVDETANRVLVAGPVRDASDGAAPAPAEAPPASTPAGPPAPPPPAAAPAPSGPVRVSSGAIEGLGHDARGSISVIRNADGRLVVRFERFDIEGVPDPRVYLVEGTDVRKPGGVDLGRLRGNRGQVLDYAVPAGTDVGPGWTVLVWCRAFSVPVANATQSAA